MTAAKKGAVGATNDPSHETSNPDSVPAINRIASRRMWEGDRRVPVVNGVEATEFDQPPPLDELLAKMPAAHRRRWQMVAFAIDYITNRDPRSLAKAGEEIGCSGVALFKTCREVMALLGLLRFYNAAIERANAPQEDKEAA